MGTGQLGQMLAHAASRLGISTVVYGPSAGPANGAATESIVASWDSSSAWGELSAQADVITYELEHLPVESVEGVAQTVPVRPSLRALGVARNRAEEKALCDALGIPVAPYRSLPQLHVSALAQAASHLGYPCLVKTQTQGYDGKGQFLLEGEHQLSEAAAAVGAVPVVVEQRLSLQREVSLLAVRSAQGDVRFYPPVENEHRHGILRVSRAPAQVPPQELSAIQQWVRQLLVDLQYVGLLTVELFDTPGGWVLNEMAPRVHNSGHLTLEGSECSQFENHVRAVMDLPLGSTAPRGASAMVNLIGAVPPLGELLAVEGAQVHLYGKAPRRGRKLGHVTVVAPDEHAREERCQRLINIVTTAEQG